MPSHRRRRLGGRLLATSTALVLVLVAYAVGAPSAAASPSPTPTPTSTPTPTAGASSGPRVAAVGPTAHDEVEHVRANTVSFHVPYLKHVDVGSAPVRPASTRFPAADQPAGTGGRVITDDTAVVFDFGTLYVISDGTMLFSPVTGATGTAVARYRVVDADGATSEARVTIVLGPGGYDAFLSARQGLSQTGDVLEDDVASKNADGSPGSIDRTSVRFPSWGQPQGSVASPSGRTLTVPGVGVFTADPSTGLVTFAADQRARLTQLVRVVYTAQDTTVAADGTVVHHSYSLGIEVVVVQVRPTAVADHGSTPYDTPVTVEGTTNDQAGAPDVPLVPGLTVFSGFGSSYPPDAVSFDGGRGLTIPHQGTWVVGADGRITFTPVPGLHGWADTVYYTVQDAYGNTVDDAAQVFVQPGPVADPDRVTTPQNVDVTVDVLTNDVAGRSASSARGRLEPASVRFPGAGQPAGATVTDAGRTLRVPGEGAYTVDPVLGTVTLDPDSGLHRVARPVSYTVQDSVRRTDGTVVHHTAVGTLTVTVTAVSPVATDDQASTTYARATDVRVLANDRAGASSAPLDASSVRLRLTADLPAGSRLSEHDTVLDVPGRGRFTARPTGVVTFAPAVGFTGHVAPVGYAVADVNGTRAEATITVDVTGAAVMRTTRATVAANETLVVDVLSNDDPPSGTTWDRSSVCLPVQGVCGTAATVGGFVAQVNDDGTISASPTARPGTRTTIGYTVRDSLGVAYAASLSITVTPAQEARRG